MADQLGRSVGDMYEGAFIPGFGLAALYAVFVFAVTVFKPKLAPALPPAAITIREADGHTGYLSLGITVAVAVAGGYLLGYRLDVIWAAAAAGLAAYVVAPAGRYLKFNLLSRLAQQGGVLRMAPAALIFLGLGPSFLGLCPAT